MHKLQAVIFDFDGTLIDSLPITFKAFNAGFASNGLSDLTPEEIMAHFGVGELQIFERVLAARKIEPNTNTTQALAQKAYKVFKTYLSDHIYLAPLHQGIHPLLTELQSLDLPLGIVTGRGRVTTDQLLKYHNLQSHFKIVLAHEDTERPKPDPEGIIRAMRILNVNPKNAVYVGDSWVDISAAKKSGTTSIGVNWDSFANTSRLKAEKPDHLFTAPHEVLSWIQKQI